MENGIAVNVQGTASNQIVIRNYPGEIPTIDAGYLEFRTVGNSDWELFDASKGIYRSVTQYPGIDYAYGYFGPQGESFRLATYEDFAPLNTDNEDYDEEPPYYYIGPGAFWNSSDDRIYIRLKQSKYAAPMGYNIPANGDPRQNSLFLFGASEVLKFGDSAAHIQLKGIRLYYGNFAVEVSSGAHHITMVNIDTRGGRYHIIVREGAHDITFDALAVDYGLPPWLARTDVKRPAEAPPGHRFQGAAITLSGQVENIEIKNSTFRQLFDAVIASKTPVNLHVHHNYFDTVLDDVLQLGSDGYDFEFDYNVVVRALAGVSWNGSGSPPAGKIGTKYIHHNIIDTSHLHRYGRSDPKNLLDEKYHGLNGDGMSTGRAFGMHSRSEIDGPDPWKVYHNTLVGAHDVNKRGTAPTYFIDPFDPLVPHEVYNNIFLQTMDLWVASNIRVSDESQVFDGNLYYRSASNPTTPMFEYIQDGNSSNEYESLHAFREATGFESSGIEGDPGLDANYRPDFIGPAASGAVDLSGTGWPGVISSEKFRGALAPTLLVDAKFLRGDCNGDGARDVSDAIFQLVKLFMDGTSSDCPEACDSNGDSASDLSDVIYHVLQLFSGGPPPDEPFPDCGLDPDIAASLGCRRAACD